MVKLYPLHLYRNNSIPIYAFSALICADILTLDDSRLNKINKMAQDWKDRLGVVYSTNPDYKFETERKPEAETPAPGKQKLRVSIDKKQRKGKTVTLVQDFEGKEDNLKELGRMLKSRCGVGGSVKDGEIIIQGEHKEKVIKILCEMGFGAR
jgi:translation initiation factor 1